MSDVSPMSLKMAAMLATTLLASTAAVGQTADQGCGAGTCGKKTSTQPKEGDDPKKKREAEKKKGDEADASPSTASSQPQAGCSKKDAGCAKR